MWNGEEKKVFLVTINCIKKERINLKDLQIEHPLYVWSGKKKYPYICAYKKCLCKRLKLK